MNLKQKKELNKYIKHIQFKNSQNLKLDDKEKIILSFAEKIITLKKIINKNDDVDIRFMIFKLKYELAIMIIDKYNLEKKNPIERLEEKRLKNLRDKKTA